MDKLQALRAANPGLPVYGIHDPEFARFGRAIPFDSDRLVGTCLKTLVMPEEGSRYVASDAALEACEDYAYVERVLMGEKPAQIGVCWGYNRLLNALEYHRASEFNVAVTDMVLLLAQRQDLKDWTLDADKAEAFFVPKGAVIEVYATSMHFCPCQVSDAGFVCLVILPRGTNAPLRHPIETNDEGRLLFAQDKWLLCHEANERLIARGAHPGIRGRNHEVAY